MQSETQTSNDWPFTLSRSHVQALAKQADPADASGERYGISPGAVLKLAMHAESELVKAARKARALATHAKRKTVQDVDVERAIAKPKKSETAEYVDWCVARVAELEHALRESGQPVPPATPPPYPRELYTEA